MSATRRKERSETNAARQARLRERRKAAGFRRISLWLSPDQVVSLERLGGEPWSGRIVKQLLESAVSEPAKQVALLVVPDPEIRRVCALEPTRVEPRESRGQPTNKAALIREAEQLQAAGLSWGAIARRWNEQGRRTDKGAEYRGANLAREVRKSKEGAAG